MLHRQLQLMNKQVSKQTNLHVKNTESVSADRTEEEEGCGDFYDEGSNHAEFLKPHWQLVGKPGQRCGNTLCFIVIGQCCLK